MPGGNRSQPLTLNFTMSSESEMEARALAAEEKLAEVMARVQRLELSSGVPAEQRNPDQEEELERLRAENEALKAKAARQEYRIQHLCRSLETALADDLVPRLRYRIDHLCRALEDRGLAPTESAPRAAAPRPPVQPVAAAGRPDSAGFHKLEIRVGRIQRAWAHEQSDKLFCEEVDVGEGAPRSIASGLRAYYSTEAMQGRNILVVTNLKARKMGGFPSQGMVLCAKSEDGTRVEFVEPPAGASPGELVTVDGLAGRPDPIPNLNLMSKASPWPAVAPLLRTDSSRVACFDGMPLVVGDRGKCTAPSLAQAAIN